MRCDVGPVVAASMLGGHDAVGEQVFVFAQHAAFPARHVGAVATPAGVDRQQPVFPGPALAGVASTVGVLKGVGHRLRRFPYASG